MKRSFALAVTVALAAACTPAASTAVSPPQTAGYPPPSYYPQPYPAQYPPAQQTAPAPPPTAYGAPPQQPPPMGPMTPALLTPLFGADMEQAELRAVIVEMISNLPPAQSALVRGIPLVVDPDLQPNAYAGCDDQGAPFIAATQGIFDALDGISQTQATDELFGTHTYDAYTAAVMPKLLSNGSAALTAGVIPAQYWSDPRRFSRAHEMFDEILAFTFGHELSHHYLGHTGCANGQATGNGPTVAQIGQLFTHALPGLNQPNEIAADNRGVVTMLDSGLARQRRGLYRWSEQGAYRLFDFFTRMERAAGISVLNPIGFLQTHPYPSLRQPLVQIAAQQWHAQHGS